MKASLFFDNPLENFPDIFRPWNDDSEEFEDDE